MRESGKGPCSPGCGEGMLPHSFCCRMWCPAARACETKTVHAHPPIICMCVMCVVSCVVCVWYAGGVGGLRGVSRPGCHSYHTAGLQTPTPQHRRRLPASGPPPDLHTQWHTGAPCRTFHMRVHNRCSRLNIAQTGGGATRSIIPTCMAPPPSQRARRHTADIVSRTCTHRVLPARLTLTWPGGVCLGGRRGGLRAVASTCHGGKACHMFVVTCLLDFHAHTPWCVLWCMYVCRATRRGLTRVACYIALP